VDRSVSAPGPETQRGLFTPDSARIAGSVRSVRKAAAARRNGARGGRPRHVGTAHQYKIREQAALRDPRSALPNLDGCTVREIPRADAKPIILRYEWLGTVGRSWAWYGLFSPGRELLGVTGFGPGPRSASRDICGREYAKLAVCLERGACVHWAPKNAASYLISRAVKLAHLEHGWSIFYAYADPAAGEIGTIYQTLGWHCIGQGVGRTPGRGRDRSSDPTAR
jgi:hypothetical protein